MKPLDNTPYGQDRPCKERHISPEQILYQRPRLTDFGVLHQVIRGASLKGVDSSGELDLENIYPS